ncbi:SRPBCC family protein [Salinimonas marina]|uniref:SRPBCC family protein n=1 Tax=Salinimonas marina TaxID=2785918 RepID=A0A7S9DWK6_9ALTE|nr:SRPBCC family protein [Salinimonas marina]QPG04555.1 SRPBCC family protein [Salinimonas marina]
MISITLNQFVPAAPGKVQAVLLQHDRLNRFFEADFKLVSPQYDGEIEGGVGAVREVCVAGIRFCEQITHTDASLIRYQIVGRAPVHNHQGHIQLNTDGKDLSGTQLQYHIQFSTPWYVPGPLIKYLVHKDTAQALSRLAAYFDNRHCHEC